MQWAKQFDYVTTTRVYTSGIDGTCVLCHGAFSRGSQVAGVRHAWAPAAFAGQRDMAHAVCLDEYGVARREPAEPYFASYEDKREWHRLKKRLNDLNSQYEAQLAAGKIAADGHPKHWSEEHIKLHAAGDAEAYLRARIRADQLADERAQRAAWELQQRFERGQADG